MDYARLSDVADVNEVNRGIDFDADILDGPLDHGFGEFFGTSASQTGDVPVYIRDRRFAANPDRDDESSAGFVKDGELLDRLTEEAVSFIQGAATEEAPFFLYLPLNAPHKPLAPNDHFRGQTDLGLYGDFVAQIDSTVGQVLDTLGRAGVHQNTLVIFTSDNGSFMVGAPNHVSQDHTDNPEQFRYRVGTHRSNGEWRSGKHSIYEGGHRVPLLAQWPAVLEAGSHVSATVSLLDLYATLSEILGDEPASGVAPGSVSLLPLLMGDAETRGEPVIHHSTGGAFAIRDGRWKLVLHSHTELYDLEQDHREQNNVAKAHPEVVKRLKAALDSVRSAEDGTLSDDATLRSLRVAGIDIGTFASEVRTYQRP